MGLEDKWGGARTICRVRITKPNQPDKKKGEQRERWRCRPADLLQGSIAQVLLCCLWTSKMPLPETHHRSGYPRIDPQGIRCGIKNQGRGWGAGSATGSTDCSFRVRESSSQHPRGNPQPSVAPVLGGSDVGKG